MAELRSLGLSLNGDLARRSVEPDHDLSETASRYYLDLMLGDRLEITRCPHELLTEALSMVLGDLAPSQRREVASLALSSTTETVTEALYVALRGGQVRGAAWGQRQPGNVAIFWPPRLVSDEPMATGQMLAEAVVSDLDATSIEMAQVLAGPADARIVPVLERVNFRLLAELLYMTCEASRFPGHTPQTDLKFTAYNDTQSERLMRLIERSYDGTLDCAGLNGVRDMGNVIAGYRATGTYRPENWLIATASDADVGILLLADHPEVGHWELLYMGLVPEARGRGWGLQIAQHAQWLAHRAGVARIVLAVDSINEPALRVYRSAGFEMWDRRSVYVRFPPESQR